MPSQTIDVIKRILQRCETLAAISELDDGVLRQYLSSEHQRANQQVARWITDAGLESWQDSVGNQWGRLASPDADAPRLILGSHLDTVPYAGKYDGILGVLIAVELLTFFAQQKPLPFHLDVVGFADEEGTRFGTTLIGSKAVAGDFSGQWLSLCDKQDVTMATALSQFGLSPEQVHRATISSEKILGYWEVHIEQGPVLEALDQPLGVVSGIAGAKRATIQVNGKAGHAGTTPMRLRSDALAAAAELIQQIEAAANQCQCDEVATVGSMRVKPGAANVIAGRVDMSLDVRALVDTDRDALIDSIQQQAADIASKRGLDISFNWYHDAGAVLCDDRFQQLFHDAATSQALDIPTLPSGAGHDAMAIATIVPVGMLFIRSPGGISHHPDESVIADDVRLAFATMVQAVRYLTTGL